MRCRKNGWKSNINIYFSKEMLPFHLFLPFILRYVKKCTKCLECYSYYIPYMFSIFIKIIFVWYNVLIDLAPWIIKHTERKKIWSKCYTTISNFLKKLVWLLSFWTEYGNNYQLFFLPESKFNVYLHNLRWRHNRFQTLRCYGGISNFATLKFGKLIPWVLVTSMPIFRPVAFTELLN